MLFGAGANAGEQDGFIGKAEAFCKRFGDESGLVVTALTLAAAMQGDLTTSAAKAGPPRTAIPRACGRTIHRAGRCFQILGKGWPGPWCRRRATSCARGRK